jgi:hypothetical protein
MSKLKTKFDSVLLKSKFSELLESIDRNNTSKMIVERYYGNISSLEISEGSVSAKDAYAELISKGVEQNKARNIATASTLSESKTIVADSHLLGRIAILESAMKELNPYSWMPQIKTFITEGQDFIKANQTYILIESVIRDLELDRNNSYYTKAINSLREASNAENPTFAVVEGLETEVWIPLVKRLYEYCSTQKGAINGQNPNFKVQKIYSPIETIDESTFAFYSSGKFLEISGNTISESKFNGNNDFNSLVKISESSKFSENQLRMYPNHNSILDITFGESPKVVLNGSIVESTSIATQLVTSGFVRFNEQDKLALIQRAVNEGAKIKEIDFGYKVTSSVFEGLSVSIFNIEDRVFVQKINKGMKENSLVEASSANEAVEMVKDFMNYDITESLSHLVENEKTEISRKNAELGKVESRIKFIIEKLADIDSAERTLGKSEFIDQAKQLLESQLKEQSRTLGKLKGEIVEGVETPFLPKAGETAVVGTVPVKIVAELILGKEYTVKGVPGYIYQGEADGAFMFNQKDLETYAQPLHMTEIEVLAAIKNGEITCC